MKENSIKGGEYATQTVLVLWKQIVFSKYHQRHINKTKRLLSLHWSEDLTIINLNAKYRQSFCLAGVFGEFNGLSYVSYNHFNLSLTS